MPTKKSRLNRREALEYQATVLRLQQTGVPVGRAGDFPQQASSRLEEYLRIDQIEPEAATIYDLPGVALVVVIPAKLVVHRGGILIAGAELTVPWDPRPLELEEPERHAFFNRVMARLIGNPPQLLVSLRLTGSKSFYRGQWKGVIVGVGYSSVPLEYQENAEVPVTLSLLDERTMSRILHSIANVDRVFKDQYQTASKTNCRGVPSEFLYFRGSQTAHGRTGRIAPSTEWRREPTRPTAERLIVRPVRKQHLRWVDQSISTGGGTGAVTRDSYERRADCMSIVTPGFAGVTEQERTV